MLIEKIEDLAKMVDQKASNFLVAGAAFEFCDEIRRSEIMASGNEWSIVTTQGWMALVTTFNHKIHRAFMSAEKISREDLKKLIIREYIIKKTSNTEQYQLVLRAKK